MIQTSPGVSAHDLDSKPSRASPPRARARARTHRGRKSSACVALPQAVSKRGAARSCVAPVAHVASARHVVSADVASKRDVTCSRGVREASGVARCSLKTWRQGARGWRRQMWRQNVASRAHVASGCQVASPNAASKPGIIDPRVSSPDVAPKRGVTCPRHVRKLPSPHMASKCGVICPGVRGPCGVASCGGKMRRHLPTWRQAAMWHHWSCTRVHANGLTRRHRTWRQKVQPLARVASESHAASPDVASGAIDLRGVAKRGVSTWRQEAQASRQVSSKRVFSHRAICAPPQATPLLNHVV